MSKNTRPINAFIIDDQQDYIDSLKISARTNRIILNSSNDLETGIESIKTNKSIEFVILDGKCFVDQDQIQTGTTVSNIPIRAKGMIDDINREQNRTIQYCVNTGFSDLRGSFEGVFEIFDKDESSKLLDHIKQKVENTEIYKLKNQYSEYFEVFDDVIDPAHEFLLIEVLNCLEKKDFKKKNFGPLRDLLEASYLGLMVIGCIPNSFVDQHGKPILEWCTRYLQGKPTNDNANTFTLSNPIPSEMKAIIRMLKEITSKNLHVGPNDILKNEFLCSSYGMLEYLVWLVGFKKAYY